MINKLSKKFTLGLFTAIGVLAIASTALATANLTFSSDTNVTVNARSYVIQSGSTATSVALAATTLTVVVPSGGSFIFVSNNRDTLANDQSLNQSCNNSTNSVTITGPLTVVFTPTSAACAGGGGGGGLTGGGGGTPPPANPAPSGQTTATVAQSTTPVTLQISPNVTMTTTSPGCSGGNKYDTATGALCVNNVTNTGNIGTVNTSSGATFNLGTKTLKNGSRGEAVKQLQVVLNKILNLGLVIDGKLGPKTIAVIKKWQKAHGLKADGLVGAKTKAAMVAEAEKD